MDCNTRKCVNASAWDVEGSAYKYQGFEVKLALFPRIVSVGVVSVGVMSVMPVGVISVDLLTVETLQVAIHKFDKTLG